MIFEQIIGKIKKDTWWSEDMPSNYQLTICAWRCFIMQSHVYKQKFLSICLALYKSDLVLEKTSEQEKLRQFHKILNLYLRNPRKVLLWYKKYKAVQKQLIQRGEWAVTGRKKFSDRKLAAVYREVYDLSVLHFTHSIIPESADIYSDQELLDQNVPAEASLILSTYPMLSFIERERLEFLQECLKRKPNFKAFAEKYHWSQNNYTGHKALDKNYFQNQAKILLKSKNREQVQREIRGLQSKALNLKKHQTQLLAEFSLTPRMAKTFELLRIMSRWIDERKFGALHMIYYVDSLLDEIIRRTKVPKDLLNYYTPEEAVNLLIKKVKLDSRIPKQRRRFSVIVTSLTKTGLDEKIYVGKQAQAIFDRFRTRQVQSFWGFVASAPVRRFKGQVCVVINPHKEKFIDGRILVTTMTRPDFVPFMHKASAIITDEGGITSHAAIVSRELGIPCIIGTKVATKVLKTGDLVEVDANLGMVKILTKAKK